MPQLPAIIRTHKIPSLFVFGLVVIIIALIVLTKIDFFPDTQESPVEIPAAPEIVISRTDRQLLVQNILEFFDNTLNDQGFYAANLRCDLAANTTEEPDQFSTAQACQALNYDPLVGLALIWGRFQAVRAFDNTLDRDFLQEDLANYYYTFAATPSGASDGAALQLLDTNIPVCSYLRDLWETDILPAESREQAGALCLASSYASPSAQLVATDALNLISDNSLSNWISFLTENLIQNRLDRVTPYLAPFSAALEHRVYYGTSPLTTGVLCQLAALSQLLTEKLPDNPNITNIVSRYDNTWPLPEQTADDDLASLATCALFAGHFNTDKPLLFNKIYTAHQTQQTRLDLPFAPHPFLGGTANSGNTWLIDVAQNGLLVGGLSSPQ